MVFCYKNCSDPQWEKIDLVIEKNFWNVRLKAEIFSNFLRSLEQFVQTMKGQNNIWWQNAFLTCFWRFLISNKLEQLEFKLEKIIGILKLAGKFRKFLFSSLLGYGVMPGAPCSKAWPDYAVIGEVIYEPVHWPAFKELYFFTIYKLCPPQSGRLHLLMYFFLCWTNCLFRANLGKGLLWKKQEPERLPCLEKFICNIWHPWPLYKHSQ